MGIKHDRNAGTYIIRKCIHGKRYYYEETDRHKAELKLTQLEQLAALAGPHIFKKDGRLTSVSIVKRYNGNKERYVAVNVTSLPIKIKIPRTVKCSRDFEQVWLQIKERWILKWNLTPRDLIDCHDQLVKAKSLYHQDFISKQKEVDLENDTYTCINEF